MRHRHHKTSVSPRALTIGTMLERRSDHTHWQVKNLFRSEKRVQLLPDFESLPRTVTFDELRREYVRTER